MSSVTAQERFDEMMKGLVAPALRAHGFTGSGRSYRIPSQEWWALLGFQKSRYNDARAMQFTINVSVTPKKAWADARIGQEHWMPERPSPNTRYAAPWWGARIGLLLPQREDKWWILSPESESAKVAAEVVNAIRDVALPAMLERMKAQQT